jgi:hypothetical protein
MVIRMNLAMFHNLFRVLVSGKQKNGSSGHLSLWDYCYLLLNILECKKASCPEDGCFLGYDSVLSNRNLLTYWMNILLPYL